MNLNFCLSIKFRALGFTFGSFEQYGWLGLSPSRQVSWGLETGASTPSGARTVINQRGVTLQVWV